MPPEGFSAIIQFRTSSNRVFAIPFGTTYLGEHWCDLLPFINPVQEVTSAELFDFYKKSCDARDNYYPMSGAVVLQTREPSRDWEIAIDTVELEPPPLKWRVAVAITFPNGCAYGFTYASSGPNYKGEWNGVWGFFQPPTGQTQPPAVPIQSPAVPTNPFTPAIQSPTAPLQRPIAPLRRPTAPTQSPRTPIPDEMMQHE